MRRLYLKIWLALIAAVAISLVGGAVTSHLLGSDRPDFTKPLAAYALSIVDEQSPDNADNAQQIIARAERQGVDLTLYGATGQAIANTRDQALPAPTGPGTHWVRDRHGGGLAVPLDQGRFAVIGHIHPAPTPILTHIATVLGTIFLLLAGASWPLARNLTKRLEALRSAVEDLGAGDLDRRIPVRGSDEVADLTRAFNQAAERISELVRGQRRMLAAASHELRSPLARVRMATELLREGHGDREQLFVQVNGDIEELDALIGDVLLASRLESGTAKAANQTVDLGLLAREEARRTGASVQGEATVRGDPRMLRRLIRNLLENAKQHGAQPVSIELSAGQICVQDAGKGISAADRRLVFEPFYRPQGHQESDGGTGLGLSLVRQIAQHHGGDAEVVNTDRGTRICVSLHVGPSAV